MIQSSRLWLIIFELHKPNLYFNTTALRNTTTKSSTKLIYTELSYFVVGAHLGYSFQYHVQVHDGIRVKFVIGILCMYVQNVMWYFDPVLPPTLVARTEPCPCQSLSCQSEVCSGHASVCQTSSNLRTYNTCNHLFYEDKYQALHIEISSDPWLALNTCIYILHIHIWHMWN